MTDKQKVTMTTAGVVAYDKVKRMLTSVEHHFQNEPERLADLNLTFEYVIASCFPQAFADVKQAIADAYTAGYLQGINEFEEKNEN